MSKEFQQSIGVNEDKALLLVLDGIDASGKSTVASGVKETLNQEGIRTEIFSTFSGTNKYWQTVMEVKHTMAVNGEPIDPNIDQTLHTMEFLSRSKNILPQVLKKNKVVIVDRYILSRLALCRWEIGSAASWPEKAVLTAIDSGVLAKPDWTILLDVDPYEARLRIVRRGPPFEVKEEEINLEKVRNELLNLVKDNRLEFNNQIVEANRPVLDIIEMIASRLLDEVTLK